MKRNILYSAAFMLFIAACGGNKTKQNGFTDNLAKSIRFTGKTSDGLSSSTTEYYTYDANNRLVKVAYSTMKGESNYSYNPTSIKTNHPKTEQLEYSLDEKGRIVSAQKPGTPYKIAVKYTPEGLVSELLLDAKNHTSFSYTNGALSKVVDIADKKTTTFTVSTGQDSIKNTFLMGNCFFDLFGLTSYQSHFITKIYRDILGNMASHSSVIPSLGFSKVTIESTDPNIQGTIEYTYQKDEKGKVTTVKEDWKNPSGIWRTFEYAVNYTGEQ